MSIGHWSEGVILVELPGDVQEHHELETVIKMLQHGDHRDVVVDFSHVHVVHGMWLARLLKIQRLAHEFGHKLTLCGLAPALRGVFTIAHLDTLFDFAEDEFTAVASPQLVG